MCIRDSRATFEAFGDRDGRVVAVSHTALANAWRAARTTAGVEARFHDLRHTCASRLLAAGVSPVAVADAMGHSVPILLATYAHLMPNDHDRIRAAQAGYEIGSRANAGNPRVNMLVRELRTR